MAGIGKDIDDVNQDEEPRSDFFLVAELSSYQSVIPTSLGEFIKNISDKVPTRRKHIHIVDSGGSTGYMFV